MEQQTGCRDHDILEIEKDHSGIGTNPAKRWVHRMSKFRPPALCLAALLAVACAWLWLQRAHSTLNRAELAMRDVIARRGRLTSFNDKLIFLAVDSESMNLNAEKDLEGLFGIKDDSTMEGKALSLMSRQWPWSREVYALLLDRLMAAGAKVVVFDMLFPTPNEGDPAFRAALDRHAGRVVLGANLNATEDENGRQTLSLTTPLGALIPPRTPPDDRIGLVNFWADADQTIREARFRTNFAQLIEANSDVSPTYPSLSAQAVLKSGNATAIPAHAEATGFRYTGGPAGGFRPRSIFEVFVPEYWERNYRGGAVFDGAIVMVGAAGNWQHDEHPTPFGVMPGPEIQLNVINALLQGEFLQRPLWKGQMALLLGFALLGVALSSATPLPRFGGLILLIGATLGGSLWAYNQFGWVAPLLAPILILLSIWAVSMVFDLVSAAAEEIRLRRRVREEQLAQKILTGANEQLERRVAERTEELTATNAQLRTLTEELTNSNGRLSDLTGELTTSNTRLSALVEEKNVLLKEIHHRVKNNMQVISSLLNLQSDHIQDPGALEIFADTRNRVRSMALIHEKLYQSSDLAQINFGEYIKALTSGLASSFASKMRGVRIATESDDVLLTVDEAVPCGLIVNELVTNCFKYAFAGGAPGEIKVALKRLPEKKLQLSVGDDGVGFPESIDFRTTESLGLQLVNTLTDQLDGSIALRNGRGTTFEITFEEKI
jgi:two-component sensor histidine kinase/CHASE2 domain-containing sensor protein